MKFWDWYLKIVVISAIIGGSMEFFMIKTGFYDKVTVLEAEKRPYENSPQAKALSETLLIHGDIRMQKQERMLSSDTSVTELEGNSGIRFEGKHPWRSASLILLLFIFLMGVASSVSQLIVSQAC